VGALAGMALPLDHAEQAIHRSERSAKGRRHGSIACTACLDPGVIIDVGERWGISRLRAGDMGAYAVDCIPPKSLNHAPATSRPIGSSDPDIS
jgi:hypothetical protein